MNHIKSAAKAIESELIDIRHHIHSHPELSFEEYKTAELVENYLNSLGIPNKRMAKTGVVGLIDSGKEGKVIALRADLDALPIQENNQVAYKSKHPGIMHACGHDVHTTCLLGAAKILWQNKDSFKGKIKLIFQPGEEKLPGGASLLIEEGVLENPKVDYIVGQHVMPLIDEGKVGFREGLYMASTDEIYLKIIGKGGHGAMPHLAIDPVIIAASILVDLQQVISRACPPHIPSVLSFGKVLAMGATNIIPNEVILEGTFRTLDEDWRAQAHEVIKKYVNHACEAKGAKAELNIVKGYPYLKNDIELTRKCKTIATEYLGSENVEELGIWMAAEDFAWYSQQVPACFYRLGIRNKERGIVHSVHHPNFDIDEDAIKTGAGLMAQIAIEMLNKDLK